MVKNTTSTNTKIKQIKILGSYKQPFKLFTTYISKYTNVQSCGTVLINGAVMH